eukprot:COSAG05_NODE_8177_length_729_cov_0.741270_1_plen_56_part_10
MALEWMSRGEFSAAKLSRQGTDLGKVHQFGRRPETSPLVDPCTAGPTWPRQWASLW